MIAPHRLTSTDDDAGENQPAWADPTDQEIWWLRRDFLERLWPVVVGRRVLEVASGPAQHSLIFARRGAQVTAVDCLETNLDQAQHYFATMGYPIETALADTRALPFDEGQFDIAFNVGSLDRLTDDQLQDTIDEMIRVVEPGGQVLAFCSNRYNLFCKMKLKRLGLRYEDLDRPFTAQVLRRRFEAQGLESVRVSGVHVHPAVDYLLPAWVKKLSLIQRWRRSGLAWLERLDACHRLKALVGQDFVVWGTVARNPVAGQLSIRRPDDQPATHRVEPDTENRRAA